MMDRDLSDAKTRVLDFLHQLDTDHAARFCHLHRVEDTSSKQSKVTVDVAQMQAEGQPDGPVTEASNDDAVPRIRPADLVPIYEIDVVVPNGVEIFNFSGIILRIAIGIEDELF